MITNQSLHACLLNGYPRTHTIHNSYSGLAMEEFVYQQYLFSSHLLNLYHSIPENYVHWTQTPEFHLFSAELPGVRKEEIKVEVEDSRYLIIRTEAVEEAGEPAKSFLRKFRLPDLIDIDGISAKYENGELKVSVPRCYRRRGLYVDPADVPEQLQLLARAA